jgi:VWFA-related protein
MRFLCFLLAVAAFAQQEYTFKSSTNLVVVNVMVRDKKGAIIEGLKPEQFTLLENGKPQTISVFQFQRLTSEKATSITPIIAAAPVASAGPLRYRDRRLLVLFFDFAGMPIPDQIRAQESAAKFINERQRSAIIGHPKIQSRRRPHAVNYGGHA